MEWRIFFFSTHPNAQLLTMQLDLLFRATKMHSTHTHRFILQSHLSRDGQSCCQSDRLVFTHNSNIYSPDTYYGALLTDTMLTLFHMGELHSEY